MWPKVKNRDLNFRPQFGHGFETVVYSVVGVAQSPQYFSESVALT